MVYATSDGFPRREMQPKPSNWLAADAFGRSNLRSELKDERGMQPLLYHYYRSQLTYLRYIYKK